jgi:hypothetical protein
LVVRKIIVEAGPVNTRDLREQVTITTPGENVNVAQVVCETA